MKVVIALIISLDEVTRDVKTEERTAKVGAVKVLVRRVVVIVLVLVLVLGVVRGGRRPVRQAGGVTRPSHSAAEIRICNTQQPLPTSHPFFFPFSFLSLATEIQGTPSKPTLASYGIVYVPSSL